MDGGDLARKEDSKKFNVGTISKNGQKQVRAEFLQLANKP